MLKKTFSCYYPAMFFLKHQAERHSINKTHLHRICPSIGWLYNNFNSIVHQFFDVMRIEWSSSLPNRLIFSSNSQNFSCLQKFTSFTSMHRQLDNRSKFIRYFVKHGTVIHIQFWLNDNLSLWQQSKRILVSYHHDNHYAIILWKIFQR